MSSNPCRPVLALWIPTLRSNHPSAVGTADVFPAARRRPTLTCLADGPPAGPPTRRGRWRQRLRNCLVSLPVSRRSVHPVAMRAARCALLLGGNTATGKPSSIHQLGRSFDLFAQQMAALVRTATAAASSCTRWPISSAPTRSESGRRGDPDRVLGTRLSSGRPDYDTERLPRLGVTRHPPLSAPGGIADLPGRSSTLPRAPG
jgi:hypothetical protein